MIPAFKNAGKSQGLEIWRIENFQPITVSARDHGKFCKGDSYIVLKTKKNSSEKHSWDVHFWLGSETTQDEAGSAAILTTKLDDMLDGAPIQHRETEDHETLLFLSYFAKGVRYLSGGHESGFNHITTNDGGQKHLYHVKGKRNVRVREVGLSVSNMNKGDCFVLEDGENIYVYVGPSSRLSEKTKAVNAANQIRDQDHNGRASIHILDEFSSSAEREEFFTALGSGSPGEVPDESTAEDDETFEATDGKMNTLYKVSDASGSLQIEEIAQKAIFQQMLTSDDCFILDIKSTIYVWVGKNATQNEKVQSMARAQDFIKTKGYHAWKPVQRIIEGGESTVFKQLFANWRDPTHL